MLTEAQRKALIALPDSGGQYAMRVPGGLTVLMGLRRRNLARIEHEDGFGEAKLDRWCRTKAGRAALTKPHTVEDK